MHIVEADEERVLQGSLLQEAFQFQHEPVALIAQGVELSQRVAVQQRLRPPEERRHERCHRDRLIAFRPTEADPHPETASENRRLFEQPALAQTGPALNEEDRAPSVPHVGQRRTNGGQFGFSASYRGRRDQHASTVRPGAVGCRLVGPTIDFAPRRPS
jgi:hypothetical protein